MGTLPAVLGPDDLPLAELEAARLDGELVPLGRGWTPIDLVVSAAERARAATLGLPPEWIAELGTAGWIWGARDAAPDPGRFCVPPRGRGANPRPGIVLRDVRLDDDAWTEVGGVRVTTPVRTIEDLARGREWGADAIALAVRLAGVAGSDFTPEASAAHVSRLPYGRRAAARIRGLVGAPAG